MSLHGCYLPSTEGASIHTAPEWLSAHACVCEDMLLLVHPTYWLVGAQYMHARAHMDADAFGSS